jgi:hypothetical protein
MTLDEAIMQLHEAARTVEQQIGVGALSDDIRGCADRLHQLIKETLCHKDSLRM